MKKPIFISISLSVLLLSCLLWWYSDTQVIKRQTNDLSAAYTITSDDGKTALLAKNQTIRNLLVTDFFLTYESEDFSHELDKEQVLSAHGYLGKSGNVSHVEVLNMQITHHTPTSASANLKLSLSFELQTGESFSDTTSAKLVWSKNQNSQWKLTKADLNKR